MEGTETLTATEVIDALVQAKTDEHARRRATDPADRPLGAAAPVPRRLPGHLGWAPRVRRDRTPGRSRGPRWSTSTRPASLAAALGITVDAARLLLADALELVYRLPRLWALVVAGVVPVWRARQIARETHDLGPDAVAYADRLICAVPDKIRLVDAAKLVHEARLYFDPDRADRRRRARARQARRLVPTRPQPRRPPTCS